jgi:UDP-N-acetylmuramoyl-tripeptide--D-alanyl-D-alanine ligase
MRRLLQKILKTLAGAILAKYKPQVIGITGSVGKTSAKEAIYSVLSAKFGARQSVKNYNNEIGLPLTIIGVESPGKLLLGWLAVFFRAIKLLLNNDKNYPEILVLEMAADKPGDLDYLTDIAKCQIAVITTIGDSHLENFKTRENIQREKATLIRKLDKDGWAALNIDNDKVRAISKETKARIFTYALEQAADLMAKEIRIKFPLSSQGENEPGISFKLVNNGSFAPVLLAKTISLADVYAALAGAAVGLIKGLNLVEISQAMEKYEAPKGRMKILSGIKNTFIIDDTYNSSPASSAVALKTLGQLPKSETAYKYAVLGDMLELGAYTEAGHREAGHLVADNKIDKLLVVGERSRDIARGARAAGMSDDDIFHFAATTEAGQFIEERLKPGDIILVKGSRAMRMEKIVEAIMAEPMRAGELLVRQEKEWKSKK